MSNNALQFPVLSLNKNITKYLMEISGPDIEENLKKGLKNQIKFSELRSSIDNPAEIYRIDVFDGNNCEVELSAAFCQYVWLLCDIVLKIADRQILAFGAKSRGMNLNKFIKTSLKDLKSHEVLPGFNKYYKCVEMFGKYDFITKLKREASLCDRLVSGAKRLPMSPFQDYKPKGKYEERVNSVYCFAIAFVLLHEHGHYDLGHMLIRQEQMSHEIDADQSAIWAALMLGDRDKRFSMICGILFGFFSFLMLNPMLKSDGVHPSEDKRLSDFHDLVKNENPKYSVLYDLMIKIWYDYRTKITNGEGLKETVESFLS